MKVSSKLTDYDMWGKPKSGIGWLSLDFCRRVYTEPAGIGKILMFEAVYLREKD